MNRLEVIQRVIDSIGAKNYLEIGVDTGMIISEIQAEKKVAVDPNFRFTRQIKLKRFLGMTKFESFEVPSDDFFIDNAKATLPNGIEVAFVDGLHTYDQCLRDIENCLEYLNDGGFIICHDCNPTSSSRAYPVKESIQEVFDLADKGELPGWDRHWNGDVWKSIVHTRLAHPELNVFTLDTDFGLGVITKKGKGVDLNGITIEDLKTVDYDYFDSKREELINLKSPEYLLDFLKG